MATEQKSEYWDSYLPSIAASAIFTACFVILTVWHLWKLIKLRTWFCLPFVIGGIFEIIGFGARAAGNKNPNILMPYLLQALLILLAPILFAASVYMILSRIIRATGSEDYSIVRIKWLTKLFVGGDVLCFAVQALGGGMLSGADTAEDSKRGETVILAGLVLQIIIFAFFLVVAIIYDKRYVARPTGKTLDMEMSWRTLMYMLYAVSVLITFRNLFRVIEYAGGKTGYLLVNEWPIYAFDGVPMVLVMAICVKWYVPIQSRQDVMGHDLESMATPMSGEVREMK